MNKGLFTVLAIILVLAIAGASFYGGMVYGKSQAQANVQSSLPHGAAGPGRLPGSGRGTARKRHAGRVCPAAASGTGRAAAFVLGTIKQIGDGSLVLTDNNGKETQVKVTDTTLIEKNQSVKLADLSEGETVMVSGSAAADGTVTARSVQVAPQGRFGFGGPGDCATAPRNPQATPAQ